MKVKRYLIFFFIYLLFTLFFFLPIFKLGGIVVGGDWTLPETKSQVEVFFKSHLNSWSNTSNLFGGRQISNTSILYALMIYLASIVGFPVAFISKLMFPLIFALAAANINLLLCSYKIRPLVSFLFGLVLITTPLFFNYSLMGWQFVLFSLALMPLFIYFFQLSLESKRGLNFILISAIIFSLAVVQSQTLIWYPLIALAVILVNSSSGKEFCVQSIKKFFLVIFFFFLLNLYWLPAMLLFPDPGVSGSNMINSSISLGTSLRLSVINLLRGWGSLFNYQFESSFLPGFLLVSFILIFLSLTIFLWNRKVNKNWLVFFILLLFPIAFYKIDRNILASLPFSNLIRDLARFSVLSTLSLVVLGAFAVNQLFLIKNLFIRRFLLIFIAVFLILNAWPMLSWGMFSYSRGESDFRFRTYRQSAELVQFEKKINQEEDLRILYLPIGALINLDDKRFDGDFEKIWDTQAAFSKNPGTITDSDRGQGAASELTKFLNSAIKNRDLEQLSLLVKVAKINMLVFRRDGKYYNWEDEERHDFENKLKKLVADGKAEVYFDQGVVLAIKYEDSESLVQVSRDYAVVGSNQFQVAGKKYPKIFSLGIFSDSDFPTNSSLAEVKESVNLPLIYQSEREISDLSSSSQIFLFHQNQDIYNIINNKKASCLKDSKNYQLKKKSLDSAKKCYQILSDTNCASGGCSNYYSLLPASIPPFGEIIFLSDQNEFVVFNGKNYNLGEAERAGKYFKLKVDNLKPGLNRLESSQAKPIFIQVVNNPSALGFDLEYRKISPGKYKIHVEKDGLKLLTFYQNFDRYWGVYQADSLFSRAISSDDEHLTVDSYANGWLIDTDKFNGDLYIIYWPDRLLVIGGFLTITILALMIAYLAINRHGYEI